MNQETSTSTDRPTGCLGAIFLVIFTVPMVFLASYLAENTVKHFKSMLTHQNHIIIEIPITQDK